MSKNRLLIKIGNDDPIDSEATYNVVVLEVNGVGTKEVGNITSQEWYGQNGEDTYIPSQIAYKAFDCTINIGVMARSAIKDDTPRAALNAFLTAIKGKSFKLIQEYLSLTLNDVYLKKSEDDEVDDDYITAKLTFRVTNP